MVKPGVLTRAAQAPVVYRERFTPATANLQFLSCGEYLIQPGAASPTVAYPNEEALLYAWRGTACVALGGRSYALANYDMLYVPKGAAYSISNPSGEPATVIVTRATAENVHPACHAEFAKVSKTKRVSGT